MSCCRNNNGNYYAHDYDNNSCGNSNHSCNCGNSIDLTGVSCPFQNNSDHLCEDSLREAACKLTNQRVIINVDGCKMCVVIVGIGEAFIKTVNPCTQKIVYFNLNRIDNIENVLPRCY